MVLPELSRRDKRDLAAIEGEAVKQDLVMTLTEAKTEYSQRIIGDIHVNGKEEFADATRGILAVKNDPNNTEEEQTYLDEFGRHMLRQAAVHMATVSEAGSVAVETEVSRTLRVAAPEPKPRGVIDHLLGRDPEDV